MKESKTQSKRSENIAFKVMPNGNIRAYQADKPDKRGVSELQFTSPENESPTVIAGNTIKVIEEYMSMKESKNDWQTIVDSKQANAFRGHIDGISPCMTEAMGMGGGQIPLLTNATIEESKTDNFMEQVRKQQIDLPDELQGKKFRIRKLTPKECFRLMGVDDKDIDTIQKSGISNSAQYKLAGNSIVVDVLFHLFRKMFIETEPDATKMDAQQLTLF